MDYDQFWSPWTSGDNASYSYGYFNHLEKYESVGKDDIPYMMENSKFMFETTNQNGYYEAT